MSWLIIALLVWLSFRSLWRRNDRPPPNLHQPWLAKPKPLYDDEESRPDNVRFPTWDEAFNRQVTDEIRFRIEYADNDGVVSEREITPLSIHLRRGQPDVYITAYCYMRAEERTFRSDRIQFTMNLKTKRVINDLGQYLRARY
ncbi:WYL domain-containing protein [Rhizobium sp. 0TCS1.26]|uniref:WYL domain-containing protein n=1 Tax=Rhizobium sp. 0TCS1.26 TaxID=3142623 RepID=UPI003D2C74E2